MASFYTTKDVPGTGKGFVATADVPRGQLIVDESPLLTYPQENARTSAFDEEVDRQLQAHSRKERDALFDLQPDPRGQYPHRSCQRHSTHE